MKVSELIKELESYLKANGDGDVRVWPYDGQMTPSVLKTLTRGEAIFDFKEDRFVPCEPFLVLEEDQSGPTNDK